RKTSGRSCGLPRARPSRGRKAAAPTSARISPTATTPGGRVTRSSGRASRSCGRSRSEPSRPARSRAKQGEAGGPAGPCEDVGRLVEEAADLLDTGPRPPVPVLGIGEPDHQPPALHQGPGDEAPVAAVAAVVAMVPHDEEG